jgi:hypothetical protein
MPGGGRLNAGLGLRIAAAALLAVLAAVLAAPTAVSGVVSVIPGGVSLEPVEPPLVLSESSDADHVATSLGPASASATVNVSVPPGYVIGLASRAAVYWSSFDSDPFTSGDLYVLNPNSNCEWSWDPSGYVTVTATGTAPDEGGECIALINRTANAAPTIWVNYVFRIDQGSGYADIVLRGDNESGSPFYTISAFEISDYLGSDYAEIYLYDGSAWSRLASTQVAIYRGYWYDMTAYRDDSTGQLALYSGTDQVVSASDSSVDVGVVGLGVFYSADTFQVDFDEVLITVGASPYYVNVTGLQPGWYVRILDQGGNVLASGTASGPTLSLDAWSWKFAPNATIEVYTDSSMATLVARATFRWIVGGDLYVVSQPSSGVTYNLINAYNRGAAWYNVSLELESYSLEGTVSNISIWAESPGSAESSSPIMIVGGDAVYNETSWVEVPSQYEARIYIYVQAEPGSQTLLHLLVRYTLQGAVTVYYPVEVNVTVEG